MDTLFTYSCVEGISCRLLTDQFVRFERLPAVESGYTGAYYKIESSENFSHARLVGNWCYSGSANGGTRIEAYVESEIDGIIYYSWDVQYIYINHPNGSFDIQLRLPKGSSIILIGIRTTMRGIDFLDVGFSICEFNDSPSLCLSPGQLESIYLSIHKGEPFTENFNIFLHEITKIAYEYILKMPGDALDIGANIGVHSKEIGRLIDQTEHLLVAVEPNPIAYRLLVDNMGSPTTSNSLCLNVVCTGEVCSKVSFFYNPDALELGSLGADYLERFFKNKFTQEQTKEIQVTAYTIDELISYFSLKLKYVKLDVESFEFGLLRYQKLLFDQRPVVSFEFNPITYPDSGAAFYNLFIYHNYKVYDCFMNELDQITWSLPAQSPIDRFAFPVEYDVSHILNIKNSILQRYEHVFECSTKS